MTIEPYYLNIFIFKHINYQKFFLFLHHKCQRVDFLICIYKVLLKSNLSTSNLAVRTKQGLTGYSTTLIATSITHGKIEQAIGVGAFRKYLFRRLAKT